MPDILPELPEVPEGDINIICMHLSDGSTVVGEILAESPTSLTLLNVFVLSKIRINPNSPAYPTQTSSIEVDPVKILLAKYDSFNHNAETTVKFFKSNIVSVYEVDDQIVQYYLEFVDQQTQAINSGATAHQRPSIADAMSKLLNEESKPNLNDLKSSVIRVKKNERDE